MKRPHRTNIKQLSLRKQISDLEIQLVITRACLELARVDIELIGSRPIPKYPSGGPISAKEPFCPGDKITHAYLTPGTKVVTAKETAEILKDKPVNTALHAAIAETLKTKYWKVDDNGKTEPLPEWVTKAL